MRVVAFDTLTGDPITTVPVIDMQWRASLTQPGAGSFDVGVRGAGLPAELVWKVRQDWATTIAVIDGGHVVYAGLVQTDRWDAAAGVLRVSTVELDQLLAVRMHRGVPEYRMEGVVVSGASLRDVQREVYRLGLASGSERWNLPVDFPAFAQGPMRFEWFGYNFKTVSAYLDELAQMDGAGHTYLRPVLTGEGRLRWRLEIGRPLLDAGTVRVPGEGGGVPVVGRATNVTVTGDGIGRRTGIFAVGAGSEMDKRFGRAGAGEVQVATHGPWMDSTVTVSQIDNQAQLDAIAAGELEASGFKRTQIDFGVMLGDWLTAEMVQPGATVVLDWPGDEGLAAGRYKQYVLAVAGGAGQELRVETQAVA